MEEKNTPATDYPTPGSNLKPHWPAIRLAAEQLNNLAEAAKLHGVTHDAVKQRARREKWLTGTRAPGHRASASTHPQPTASKPAPRAKAATIKPPSAAAPSPARRSSGKKPASPKASPPPTANPPAAQPAPLALVTRVDEPPPTAPQTNPAPTGDSKQQRKRGKGIRLLPGEKPRSGNDARDERKAEQMAQEAAARLNRILSVIPPRRGPIPYNEELAEFILEQLAAGDSLTSICSVTPDMPSMSTVLGWTHSNASFLDRYTRAREIQAHSLGEKMIAIANDGANDTYVDEKGNRKVDWDVVKRSQLRVDTIKWYIARMHPRLFGDQMPQQTAAGPAVVLNIGLIAQGLPADIRQNYRISGQPQQPAIEIQAEKVSDAA